VVKLKIYQTDKNYLNNFRHARNTGVPEIASIDWHASVAEVAYKEEKVDKKRQHRLKELWYGRTGGQCATRVGSSARRCHMLTSFTVLAKSFKHIHCNLQ
jgi:hypothetical protein